MRNISVGLYILSVVLLLTVVLDDSVDSTTKTLLIAAAALIGSLLFALLSRVRPRRRELHEEALQEKNLNKSDDLDKMLREIG
ncbi:hypothetical protein B7R21_18645 [Subtercola boreus]|uniref:Uncharacterized protein n=1 Tax=Subtercola boreus TaxID=120213 RepID=A0A3E0VBK9_9MICO|nr:hypothetical protein B7R21_18645 [Subtercola boreus]